MTRDDLKKTLKDMNVRADAYSLDGGHPSEAYVLAAVATGWRVYYSERGQETSAAAFDSESAACQHLLSLVERDPTTRQ